MRCADEAAEHVLRAAGRKRNDHGHRPVWIVLRAALPAQPSIRLPAAPVAPAQRHKKWTARLHDVTTGSTGPSSCLTRRVPYQLRVQPRSLDRGRPFRDLALDEACKIVRRTALGRDERRRRSPSGAPARPACSSLRRRLVEPPHDRRRRALRQEQGVPASGRRNRSGPARARTASFGRLGERSRDRSAIAFTDLPSICGSAPAASRNDSRCGRRSGPAAPGRCRDRECA